VCFGVVSQKNWVEVIELKYFMPIFYPFCRKQIFRAISKDIFHENLAEKRGEKSIHVYTVHTCVTYELLQLEFILPNSVSSETY
jgi:hypothetical protein